MLRFILLTPVILVLIVFAASNPQLVTLALWPTALSFAAPLSVATLVIAAIFFLAGALTMWVPRLGTKIRAIQAERQVAKLQEKVSRLEAQIAAKKAPAPAPVAVAA
jgi:uncharacterized membrane protein YciS (DUF1049 family)